MVIKIKVTINVRDTHGVDNSIVKEFKDIFEAFNWIDGHYDKDEPVILTVYDKRIEIEQDNIEFIIEEVQSYD
jgi:hypothetical protein